MGIRTFLQKQRYQFGISTFIISDSRGNNIKNRLTHMYIDVRFLGRFVDNIKVT
jgi:hypothetical protein